MQLDSKPTVSGEFGAIQFGYKQHTVVDGYGLVLAVNTAAINCHDSKPLLDLLDQANIQPGTRIHADKAYCSQKHRDALKFRAIKNVIQDKATKNNLLSPRQLQQIASLQKSDTWYNELSAAKHGASMQKYCVTAD